MLCSTQGGRWYTIYGSESAKRAVGNHSAAPSTASQYLAVSRASACKGTCTRAYICRRLPPHPLQITMVIYPLETCTLDIVYTISHQHYTKPSTRALRRSLIRFVLSYPKLPSDTFRPQELRYQKPSLSSSQMRGSLKYSEYM